MAPRLQNVRILVDDLEPCLRFYRDVLGLTLRLATEGGEYAELETPGANIGLYRRDLMAEVLGDGLVPAAGGDAVLLNIEVDDLDRTVWELEGRGVRLLRPPQDQPTWGMRVAHVRDPAGTLIELYSRLSG